ncbi:exosortase-associated protein EpsI, B-type [Massilia glaciei]|uniref:EpsI family protein n=1 Tax=Massilia glaciei TaxID=1524097 RepID=A0A2U2HC07_9BURK|nr:exosortase-associated protein EpsI, B-type [Massilia glaciei]PWF40431.1 EpsI family protein [Massilia glaciei]
MRAGAGAGARMLVSLLMAALMAGAAVVTWAITPTAKLAATRPAVDLPAMVPSVIGEWREDKGMVAAVVNPETEAALSKLYAQTISRSYVHRDGRRVMLSIAYGRDQGGEATQVHRPEFCYAAQGFSLDEQADGALATPHGAIPVRRMVAVQGARVEPITYWITVGDRATLPGLGRKLAQLSYGLNGAVPDGLLFRVSSIGRDKAQAYRDQDAFANALLAAASPAQRVRLAGLAPVPSAAPGASSLTPSAAPSIVPAAAPPTAPPNASP